MKGNQVAPSELEGYLLSHRDVADAAVIGIPHEYAGEVPLAFVVLKQEVAKVVVRDAIVAEEARAKLYQVSLLPRPNCREWAPLS